MKRNGTPVYARQHKRGLTLPQQNAVDLLAAGKTDTDAAGQLNLSRTTITKWRLYDPVFQAALNGRRAEVWGAAAERLRALVPQALETLAGELGNVESPNRFKAALEVLKLAQLPAAGLGIGPADAEEIVRRLVEEKRKQAPGLHEMMIGRDKFLPPVEEQIEDTWRELEAKANEADAVPADGG